ncbi:MAG: hypothetical protein QXX95_02970 [Nitrososphaerales archaeon]
MEKEEIFLTEEEIKTLEEEERRKELDLILKKRNKVMEYFTFEDVLEERRKGFSVKDFVDMALYTGRQIGEEFIVFRFKNMEEMLVSVNIKEENSFLYNLIVSKYERELTADEL